MNRYFRLFPLALLLVTALFVAGCAPLNMEMPAADDAMADTTMTDEGAEDDASMAESSEMMEGDGAVATVATRSLRVRQSPDEAAEVVAGVKEGETYRVLSISEDGQWVQLAVAAAPGGQGWVSANYVSVNGALTGGEDEMAPEAPEAAEMTETEVMTETEAMTETSGMTETAATEIILEPTPAPAEESSEAMVEESMDDGAMAEEEVVAPEAGYVLVNTDGTRLRVHAEADTESEIVGYIYDGETYQVLEVSEDGTWVKIAGDTAEVTDNPDGGWVAAEFLVLGE